MMSKVDFLKRINSGILLSDGAWGTELQRYGLKTGECPELLNTEQSEIVFKVAKSYVDAGSDIIETNSFGGSQIKLGEYGLAARCYELNKAAAEISLNAARNTNTMVLGSVGPTGKFLMTGEVSEDQMLESFHEQLKGLIDGGVDGLIFETFYDLEEISIALKAAGELMALPIVTSFTFQKTGKKNFNTIMGNSVQEIFEKVVELDVDVIGTNCGNGIIDMVTLVENMREINPILPIIVQSNAGMPSIIDSKLIYNESAEMFKENVEKLISAGANIIGGCCGTNPEYIAAMREELNRIETRM